MKDLFRKTIAFLFGLLLLAQGAPVAPARSENNEKISVLSTIFAPYDFARQIAGGLCDVQMLLPPGSESHSYEPTPQDIIAISEADVFIHVGGESDAWVERILDALDAGGARVVTLMDCVELVEEELVEGMEPEEEEAHEEEAEEAHEYDEHIWTSPKNAILIVQKLKGALAGADPANADAYEANAAAYIEKLSALDEAFIEVVEGAARTTVVFGDRFPFRYLADAYGLSYYAAFPGCATETDASPRTLAFLIDTVQSEGIPAVFHLELSNGKIADAICESTGAAKLLLHSCHNVTRTDFENGETYLSLMEKNVDALREALQ